MRQLPFFVLIALAATLAGCASSTTTGVCARLSDLDIRQEYMPYRNGAFRHSTARPQKFSQKAAAVEAEKEVIPEPRPTSTEWWTRENARLRKATAICRGCLPDAIATVLLPRAPVLPSLSDSQLFPSTSMNRVEGSAVVDEPQQP
jgi:hypothetical protein